MPVLAKLLELLFRYWPAYPPDWERRRLAVFDRAFGRCEDCGCTAGRLRFTGRGVRVAGAHVHHVRHRAHGGNHALENLRLLCADCHSAQHPENEELRRLRRTG